ncbi:MAG: C-GCAxxG-C-C family protein [Faecousia sp.]
MEHQYRAAELFLSGSNCAQAVLLAFGDVTGLDPALAARLSCGFGGGMGRLREVCGAFSGMLMALDLLYGYADPGINDAAKKAHYALIQDLAARFRAETGSLICREILTNPPSDPTPSPRTTEYYATRPCTRMVMIAARILDEYMAEHPLESRQ